MFSCHGPWVYFCLGVSENMLISYKYPLKETLNKCLTGDRSWGISKVIFQLLLPPWGLAHSEESRRVPHLLTIHPSRCSLPCFSSPPLFGTALPFSQIYSVVLSCWWGGPLQFFIFSSCKGFTSLARSQHLKGKCPLTWSFMELSYRKRSFL